MSALGFNILGWKAWSARAADSQPDVTIIPAMLRRRLSLVGRAALSVIIPLVDTHGSMPLVYVSRHGDLNRTLGLLRDLAHAEPMSPTAFSLSVHNAIAGLFSIHQGLTANITAISGGRQDLIPALLEVLGLCHANGGPVLCVFCDEPPPDLYKLHVNQPEHAYALAIVVSAGSEWSLTSSGQVAENTEAADANPQSLTLLTLLEDSTLSTLTLPANGSVWSIQRSAS
ncbi:3-oxoacyl-ACP synthase [Cellvibrio sp. KY-GH-1]|uniref:beta-ketoacyl synthase chain length factor n=1 Tax=Cellvibrio sp. KY-GH-1 TaxID=2303332 RepID=UPI001249337A|nr:beta-ketoacyl synthase chain length factor [Cellvibrio sp. KY-GH-1]QEY17421.1 3-oxoacyl-ACP synthase [Cellvibrio sp. KY-GH-1]